MKLEQIDLVKLLPEFMRSDRANRGLAAGANIVLRDVAAKAKLLTVWDKIDSMTDEQLDELAWELNIEWYKSTADTQTKRAIIKSSDKVHAKLGTKWAVEQIITDYFGSGAVREWWEYGGEPYHFKVFSTNPGLVNEHHEEFLAMLEVVKRKSAWLDAVIISLTGEMNIFAGVATHDLTFETHTIGDIEAIAGEAAALAATF